MIQRPKLCLRMNENKKFNSEVLSINISNS
jgi:hypothetical protein